MKTLPKTFVVALTGLTVLFANLNDTAQAQTNQFPRNGLIALFTNNPVALNIVTNLLNEPQPALSVPVVSHTNSLPGGTYWTLSAPAPLPFNPYPDLPVYQVSTNPDFIIDDRSVDYATLDAENASNNPVTFQPMGFQYDTNGLYIAVPTNSLAVPNFFTVNVVNTIIGQSYDILTTSDLLLPSWMTVLTTNAVSNITQVQVPMSSAKLFVQARESTGTSFYINESPLNQTVEDGDSVTFSVATGGNPNLTYQWTFNGVAIDGATNSSYTISNVQDGDAGEYAVTISDGTNPQTASAQLTTDSSSPFGYTQTGNANLIPILGSRQDYAFKSGNTYYISAATSFYGQTTVEGGAVIKPDWYSGGNVQIMGTLDVKAEPYYPAIFTSVDDDSIGEVLGFSQQDGAPVPANNGLAFLDLTYAQSNAVVSNVQIKFADIGVTTPQAMQSLDVWDSQFYECDYAIANLVNGGTNNLHNVLFADCNDAVRATTNAITINGEQITADVTRFCQSTTTPTQIALTNSLYWGTTLSASSLSTVNVTHNPSNANFTSEGYGYYYLAANSPLHNAGSASISPRLQNELQHKTTYAPVPLAVNTTITGNLTLSPQAQRYTNGAPDIGYYYDALDYTVANFTLASGNLTVLPNTAIAVRNDYNSTNGTYSFEGFFVEQGSSITSHGTPNKPNVFTAERLVQETPETDFATYKNNNGWWFGAVTFVTDSEPNSQNSLAAVYGFRFTKFYLPLNDYHFWSGYDEYEEFEISPDSSMYLTLQDSQFRGGRINLGNPDQGNTYPLNQVYPAGALYWMNNSFENTTINLDPTYNEYGYGVNSDMQLLAYNNLFKGGNWLRLEPIPASAGNWTFENNLFDKVNFLQDTSQPLNFDHNGYWPLQPSEFLYGGSAGELATTSGTDSGGEVTLSNAPPYQSGVFGKFYLPDTTPLYSAGSTNAAGMGLYQYTTRLDQTKEGDETAGHMVNIGVHYVAATGNVPKDTDGDGIPDYVEDANGNGIVDANETDPNNPMSDGVTNDIYNTAYLNVDLSGDGLAGRVKAALGMNPLDTSNPLTLTQIITGEEPEIETYEVPISYNLLTNTGNLYLLVDGGQNASFQECDQAPDGNCLLLWNSTFDSPGQHYFQAQLILNGQLIQSSTPDLTVLTGVGTIGSYYSTNICQFNPFYSTFNSSGAILYATTPSCPNANYTIELQTLSGQHIKTITNSTSNGVITENWDLTDDNGNTITDSTVRAVFNVSLLDPATGSLNFLLYHALTGEADGNFTVAYAWDNSGQAQEDGSMWDAMQGGVVNQLLTPVTADGGNDDNYNSDFNRYTGENYPDDPGNPGYLSGINDVTNLLGNLEEETTMNFYFNGHGSPDSIGNNPSGGGGVAINAGTVAYELGNTLGATNAGNWNHPYRFVFLDACDTADQRTWAHTFGILDSISETDLANDPAKAQAFVGYIGEPRAPSSDTDWEEMGDTYTVFYEAWMLQYPLQQCINIASSTNPFGDGSVILDFPFGTKFSIFNTSPALGILNPSAIAVNNFTLKIYGYPYLQRTGYYAP